MGLQKHEKNISQWEPIAFRQWIDVFINITELLLIIDIIYKGRTPSWRWYEQGVIPLDIERCFFTVLHAGITLVLHWRKIINHIWILKRSTTIMDQNN